MGLTGSATSTYEPNLAYGGTASSRGFGGSGNGTTIGALPANAIFATLVPTNATIFVSAGLDGSSVTSQLGQPLTEGKPLYLEASFGSPTASQPVPGLSAITVSPGGENVYALSVSKNLLVVANGDLSQRQTIAVSGLTAASR